MPDYDINEAFACIEDELIASMFRNFKRHRAEEAREGYNWEMWQALQLKALDEYRRKNKKKFSKKFSSLNSRIDEFIRQARTDGAAEQEIKILEAVKRGYKPKRIFRGSAETSVEFIRMNTRKMDALIKATARDLNRAEHAMLRMANDQYRKIIFNAQVYAASGAGTYEKAVDMAAKDFLKAGINCIEYKNGARHTIRDYVSMVMATTGKRAYLTGEGEMRKQWGESLVIMNKRGNPCPMCAPFVGKVLVDDVWSGGKPDGKHMLMSTAIAKGLYHPRCKDGHTTYFEGISDDGEQYTDKEKKELTEQYNAEQKRRYAENQAEKYGRMSKYSLDNENKSLYSKKAVEWNKIAGNHVDKSGGSELVSKMKLFKEAKTIDEAEKFALEHNIRHVDYSDLPIETANLLNKAAMTLPEDIRPAFIGSGRSIQKYSGCKFSRKEKDYFGVHVDVMEMHFGEYPNIEYDFEGGNMVGISAKYRIVDKIEKAKIQGNIEYSKKHDGHTQFFNTDGKSTAYHEMGHVYADKKGIPDGFETDAKRWYEESKCDMLKTTSEAWAEAWGAYHTENSDLPDYIAKYISQVTELPLDKSSQRGIIKTNENFEIHPDKINKFLLKPGSKHSKEFFDVGYSENDYNRLFDDIAAEFNKSKIVDIKKNTDGTENFSTFMELGVENKKRFRIVWRKDTPESKPRLITGHRED